ncbi:MAG: hypothetical protein Q7S00_06120, partial [bacterium]|nr:hypothetical protein [bacterium]
MNLKKSGDTSGGKGRNRHCHFMEETEEAMARFNEGKTLHWDELFEISWQFSKTSGLVTPEVKRTVERIQE